MPYEVNKQVEPRLYGIFLGNDRKFPKGEVIEHGRVYPVKINLYLSQAPGINCTMVEVDGGSWKVILPYASPKDIWEDWMPYNGRRLNVHAKTHEELDGRRLETLEE